MGRRGQQSGPGRQRPRRAKTLTRAAFGCGVQRSSNRRARTSRITTASVRGVAWPGRPSHAPRIRPGCSRTARISTARPAGTFAMRLYSLQNAAPNCSAAQRHTPVRTARAVVLPAGSRKSGKRTGPPPCHGGCDRRPRPGREGSRRTPEASGSRFPADSKTRRQPSGADSTHWPFEGCSHTFGRHRARRCQVSANDPTILEVFADRAVPAGCGASGTTRSCTTSSPLAGGRV